MILVSILGDFHSSILPITYTFRKKISKHIIIYDDAKQDVKKAKRLIAGQKAFLAHPSRSSDEQYVIETMKIDEDDRSDIEKCFTRIMALTENPSDIYVNTTDGLSSVAIVLSSLFLPAGATILSYDRYANTYNLHSNEKMTKHQMHENMDIESHLLLKGYIVRDVSLKKDLEKRKDAIYALTKDLTRFKAFANSLQNRTLSQVKGYKDYRTLLRDIDIKDTKFIQGTVFEEYIYHLMVDHFDFDDVWVGVKIEFEEAVENEFDILMIKENHLHTIECKLVSKLNGMHFLYKTELIKDYLDDDGKAMLLSIGADNVVMTNYGIKKIQFTKASRGIAKHADIKIHQSKVFDEKHFLHDVEEYFLA